MATMRILQDCAVMMGSRVVGCRMAGRQVSRYDAAGDRSAACD